MWRLPIFLRTGLYPTPEMEHVHNLSQLSRESRHQTNLLYLWLTEIVFCFKMIYWLTSGDALVDVLSAPVSVLGVVQTLEVHLMLTEGLLLLVLLVLLEHLEVDRLVVGVSLLVPEVLVHGVAQDGVVLFGHC